MPQLAQLIKELGPTLGVILFLIILVIPYVGMFFVNRRLALLKHDFDMNLQKVSNVSQMELHAYRLQYEKEFQAYTELWQKAVDLHRAATGLRPAFDYHDPSETEDDRKKRRLKAYSNADNAFCDVVHYYRPFYAKEVYDKATELMLLCRTEQIGYNLGAHNWAKYWEEALQNASQIVALSDGICLSIRARIWGGDSRVPSTSAATAQVVDDSR